MTKQLCLILIISGLSFFSCKKDDSGSGQSNLNEIAVTISGQVIDENGSNIQGAIVRIGNNSLLTGANGEFVFKNIKVPAARYYVSSIMDGFFDSGYGGIPQSGTDINFRVTMISKGISSIINSSSGGEVNTPENSKVTFPMNAFETITGAIFTGNAQVYTKYVSTENLNFSSMLPGGDLAVLVNQNSLTTMKTYCMLGVLLEDSNNNSLKLRNGKTAEIRFPIPAADLSSAPSSIALMSFNPISGSWAQEGQAIKSGNEYIGIVSHFSWWSCSSISSHPAPTISGRVVDCNGNYVPGVIVNVNMQYSLYTNTQGAFHAWVPQGIPITAQVISSNNNGVISNSNVITVQPGQGNTILSNLIVDCPAYISGNVTCDSSLIGAFVKPSWSGGVGNVILFDDGHFFSPVPQNTNITMEIFIAQSNTSTIVMSGNNGSITNIGNIQLCGNIGGCSGGSTSISDIDGNVYDVVQIGNQCWMQQNLKTSKYRNGDNIITGLNDSSWFNISAGAYSIYNNDNSNNNIYGKLYNYYAVADSRGLCPVGWHVPTDLEWNELVGLLDSSYLPGVLGTQSSVAGGMIKSEGTLQDGTGLWSTPNIGASNFVGFDGFPAGERSQNGLYQLLTTNAAWWSSTEVYTNASYYRTVNHNVAGITRFMGNKPNGRSVRCIRD